MKNNKLICLALPIMLSGIGCSNNDIEKEKDVIKKDDKVEDLKRFSNLKEYQEAVYKLANKFESELRATKPIIEKDKTLLTNKDELKAQYDRVQVQADKIKSLHPPQEYTDLQIGLIDSLIVYQKAVDGIFSGLDVRDKEKVKGYEQSVIDGLTYFNDSLNAIKE